MYIIIRSVTHTCPCMDFNREGCSSFVAVASMHSAILIDISSSHSTLFFRSLALHIWFRQRTTFPTFVAHCTEKVHYGGKSLPLLGTSQKVVRYVVEAEAGLSSLLRRQCMCGYRQVNTEQAGSLLSLLGHGKGLTFQSLRSI